MTLCLPQAITTDSMVVANAPPRIIHGVEMQSDDEYGEDEGEDGNFELSEEEEDEMADFEVAREQRLQMGNGDYDEL